MALKIKTLYLECNMGAAGDMLMAALLELCDDRQGFLDRLNGAGIPGVAVTAEPSVKCGITGTCVRVTVNGREEECHDHHHGDDNDHHRHHHNNHNNHNNNKGNNDHDDHHHHDRHHREDDKHHHNDYRNIEHLIDGLKISDTVKQNAFAIYKLIADAESHAHGVPVDRIHFHEVGDMDAVADIVGVCMLMEDLAPDVIISSPINVGGGHVHCAHGVLPVPAPATARILRDVPIYGESSIGELCTPTGAAILKRFAKKFCDMPVMTVGKIGCGMGKRDFKRANCVRAFIGDVVSVDGDIDNTVNNAIGNGINNNVDNIIVDDFNKCANDNVIELSCNLDDMTPEAVAFAQELLLKEGALDAWTSPIVMKKGRLGALFSCLCRNDTKDKMLALIFKHTTTLGIRENSLKRYILHREQSEIRSSYGPIRIKTARGFGVEKSKPEYEDIARIARESGVSMRDL